MKNLRITGALALLLAAGSAHAQSFIPGNQVDDFGPFTYSTPVTTRQEPLLAARSSPISMNYVDDFGPLVSERSRARVELGAAGGEPGMDVVAAERARHRAAIDAFNRDQFVRATWAATP